jgi:hypothetical protein
MVRYAPDVDALTLSRQRTPTTLSGQLAFDAQGRETAFPYSRATRRKTKVWIDFVQISLAVIIATAASVVLWFSTAPQRLPRLRIGRLTLLLIVLLLLGACQPVAAPAPDVDSSQPLQVSIDAA